MRYDKTIDKIFRLLPLILLCMFSRIALAQEPIHLLKTKELDTNYILDRLKEAKKIAAVNQRAALDLDYKYLQISLNRKFWSGGVQACLSLAGLHRKENLDSSIHYMLKAISLSTLINNKLQLAEQYTMLAALYETKGDFQQVKRIYDRTNVLFRNEASGDNRYLLSRLLNNMGRAYFQTGKFDSSLLFYERSLSNLPRLDRTNYADAIISNSALGMIYARVHNRAKGIYYFKKAYELACTFKDTAMQVNQLGNLGVIYYESEDDSTAKQYLYSVLNMPVKDDQKPLAQIYGMLAAVLCHRERDPDSLATALKYAQLSYYYAGKSDNPENRIQSLYIIGLASRRNGYYKEAEQYLLEGIGLALQIGKVENISMAYSNLSEVYNSTGQFKKAFDFQTRYIRMKDSLEGSESARRTAEVEQQYRSLEKDKKLAEQRAAMQIQASRIREMDFWIIGIIITCLLLAALFAVLYKSKHNRQKAVFIQLQQQQEINLLKAKTVAESEERNRIGKELHDGIVSQLLAIKLHINALHSKHADNISGQQLDLIAQQLEEVTMELRSTAHNLMPENLIQLGLVKAIEDLCEKISVKELLEVDFQAYGAFPLLDDHITLSLYRMVQELVQNVLKHANATLLLVQLSYRNSILSITVEDNGIGFNDEQEKIAEGRGILNIKKRVLELNGSMDISSRRGEETTVYLEFEEKWLR